ILGAPILFLIDGLSFLFSAFSELFIRIPQHIPEKSKSLREEFQKFKQGMRVGLNYVWETRGIRTMMFASSFLAFLTAPVLILLPVFVRRYLNAGPEAYGFLLAAYGLGTMMGYVLAGVLGLQGRVRARVLIAVMFAEAGSYAVLGLMRSVPPALGFAVVGGALDGFVIVNLTTILQLTTPSEIRGRVFGLLGTISSGLAPIGMGLAGVVADLVHQNIPLIYISVSVLMALLILVAAADPHFREYLAYKTEQRPRKREPEPETVPVEMVDGRIL
ncbi:MAG: MFS transporter, partial [Calditrichaeota bacterium]|nr:MFS transporter [Calditrichota bacterium]